MNFRDFLEASRHAVDQVTNRIMTAARANPDIIPNPQELLTLAIKNIDTAETIYQGPKTYAVEILPTFPVLLSSKGSFPIPRTAQEARALPQFHIDQQYGSVGNMLVAILEPPEAHHARGENELNTSTVKFQRSPDIPVIGSRPRANEWIKYTQFQRDIRQHAPPAQQPVATAAQLLDPSHPLHDAFMAWLGDKPPTKRQARAFLRTLG